MAEDTQLEKDAKKQLREDTERIRAFQEMVATKGWKLFCELLNRKVEEKTIGIFDRPSGEDSPEAAAWDKGACHAFLYARDLPATTIAAYKATNSDPAAEENE